jgi:ketosteroid isomerase-like protein
MVSQSEQSDESREIVRQMYDATIKGDVAAVLALLDDNVVCHESPVLPYGRDYHGAAGIQELFEPLSSYLAVEKITIDSLIADGDHVVAMVRLPVRSSGVELRVAEHHRVRDGKVVEQWIYHFHPTQVR